MNIRQTLISLLCILPALPAAAVTLTNRDDVEMQISSVEICGHGGAAGCSDSRFGNAGDDFAITGNTCGDKVPARASCEISVNFTPSDSGERTATLRVKDSEGIQEVSLSGYGQGQSAGGGSHAGGDRDRDREKKDHQKEKHEGHDRHDDR